MTQPGEALAGTAQVFVLHEGYAREEDDADRVGSTVTLIVDGGRVIVVDPGMVSGRDALLSALAAHVASPAGVTDVVFSHHHPDHTINAALFPGARDSRPLGQLRRRPLDRPRARGLRAHPVGAADRHTGAHRRGHHDARRHPGRRVRVDAPGGARGPADDPLGTDQAALHQSRARILEVATVIVPGHGPAFRPAPATPR